MADMDCDFSFCGLRASFDRTISSEEKKHGIVAVWRFSPTPVTCVPRSSTPVLRHLGTRLQRALLYCEQYELLPADRKVLVISGGVGSNQYLRDGLAEVCAHHDCRLVCPPPKLCTDNGIMIALEWGGEAASGGGEGRGPGRGRRTLKPWT